MTHRAEVTLARVDEDWIAGLLTEAMSFGEEEAGKERNAVVETMDNGQGICVFYA